MKIALFSVDGVGFPLAYHLQEEGHEVYVGQVSSWDKVKVKEVESTENRRKRLNLYDRMFTNKWPADRLTSFLLGQPSGRRRDWFVICDFNWLWMYADKLRQAGYRGLLPHREDYQLEHDRKASRDLIDKLYPDVETGDYKEFKKPLDGIEHLEKNEDKMYVLKGFNTNASTVVPDSDDPEINREILTDALEQDRDHNYEKDGFILEEKIPDIIEFTPCAIGWDGELRCVNVDIEHKRFGSRSGPLVGCATGVVLWQRDYEKIYQMFLEPLANKMLRKNEMTVWDLSVLYSPSLKKYYAGEFCGDRMGFDAVFSEISTFGSATAWLEHIMGNETEYKPVGVSLRVLNPEKSDALFIGDPADPNVWCYDLHEEDDKYRVSGLGKDAYVLTESGDTIDDALKRLYELEHDVEFDPGYHFELSDWHDKEWPINVLHRVDVLRKLGLIGGEDHGKGSKKTERDGNGRTETIGTATGQTRFGRGNASIRGYA